MTELNDALRLLKQSRGYVDGCHDEGCEKHFEFGQQNFESAEDARAEEADAADMEFEPRDYDKDAACDCGTDELINQIDALLAAHPIEGTAE